MMGRQVLIYSLVLTDTEKKIDKKATGQLKKCNLFVVRFANYNSK